MAKFSIDGRDFVGRNVNIDRNGKVTIDGVVQDGSLTGVVEIRVTEGVIENLSSYASVRCGEVQGNVDAGGSVQCGNVGGDVDAGGSVQCANVTGSVDAGGSVTCGKVSGNVDAGGSIRMN